MTTPVIQLVAYEARDKRVFVRVPDERGRYVLTSRSVVEVACPQCASAPGEPCKFSQGYGVGTHFVRESAWRRSRPGWTVPGNPPDQLPGKPRYKLITS